MSIATAIVAAQQRVAEAYEHLEEKGATMPDTMDLANMPDTIDSIPSGDDSLAKGIISRTLTDIVIPSGVTTIAKNVFYAYSALKSVTIPSGVTSIKQYAFAYSGLTSVVIPNTVTEIDTGAFRECSSLVSVVMPNAMTTCNAEIFNNCTALTSIKLPEALTELPSYFLYNCAALTKLDIPASVAKLTGNCIYRCSGITELTIRRTTPPELASAAWPQSSALAHIYVPSASIDAYKAAANWSDYASIISAITE